MKNDILIYGAISKDEYSSAFVNFILSQIEGDSVRLRLNSPGGSVVQAEAIYSILRASGKKVSVHIDGVAASAAMHLFMKFEDRYAFPDTHAMIHRVKGGVEGDYEQIRNSADYIEKVNNIYKSRIASVFGVSEEEADTLMKNETWFTGQELIEKGIAKIDPDEQAIDRVAAMAKISDFSDSLKNFQKTPGSLIAVNNNQTDEQMLKAELAKVVELKADAEDTLFVQKVQSLQSRAELVSGLEAKVTDLSGKLSSYKTQVTDLQTKLEAYEVDKVTAEVCEKEGVKLSAEHQDAFTRRAKRYHEATDETVKADLKADLHTYARLNGVPVGADPTLTGQANGNRQDGNAEEQLNARVLSIQAEAKKSGKDLSYPEALQLAMEAK
jgi:ATP-dependent protease ClpP protease subunit